MQVSGDFPSRVKIVEVGPRDGLQNISQVLPVETRVALVDKLTEAGLRHIEVGSFVSPKRVPAMADSDKVFKAIKRKPGIIYSALTPNLRGFEDALAAGANEVAVFCSASEGFSRHNINCSIAESINRFNPVIEQAQKAGIPVRGYLSCVMGCPYDGDVPVAQVADLSQALIDIGCYEVSLGDTLGIGTPLQAKAVVTNVAEKVPVAKIAAHFHDTHGQALANLYAVMEEGVAIIDAAVGGLGGCPYAPGASGNVPTEKVLYMLQGMGIKTGVNAQYLKTVVQFVKSYR